MASTLVPYEPRTLVPSSNGAHGMQTAALPARAPGDAASLSVIDEAPPVVGAAALGGAAAFPEAAALVAGSVVLPGMLDGAPPAVGAAAPAAAVLVAGGTGVSGMLDGAPPVVGAAAAPAAAVLVVGGAAARPSGPDSWTLVVWAASAALARPRAACCGAGVVSWWVSWRRMNGEMVDGRWISQCRMNGESVGGGWVCWWVGWPIG